MGSSSPLPIAVADDCISPKKRRIWCSDQQSVQNHGRISALPDDILIKILSLMTIGEAALTDCLSTRWRHLWKKVDNVTLDRHNFGMQAIENANDHGNSDLWNLEATSCHALRKLSLINCDQLFHVRIYSSKLVKMEVLTCKSIIGININAEKLDEFWYMGHKVDIVYECAPVLRELYAHFVKRNECQLDCIGAFSTLRKLILVFPSRLQVSRVLQHSGRFTVLKQMVLYLMTSRKKRILSVVYLLKAAPLVEILKLELYGKLKPLQRLKIKWPKDFTAEALSTISIGGFSGEQELVDLLLFLLGRSPVLKELRICTHPRRYKGNVR